MPHSYGNRIIPASAGLAVAALALVAGCTSGAGSARGDSAGPGTTMHGAQSGGVAAPAAGTADGSAAGPASGSASGSAAAKVAPAAQQRVYTAQLSVRARNVDAAVTKAAGIATGAGGYVASENLLPSPGSGAPASGAPVSGAPVSGASAAAQPVQLSADVQLKIPVGAYPATLARLDGGAVGTRLSLQQQAQDVTQQVADVGSQVTSDRAAIAQLRSLLSRSGSVSDLLSVQNQINSEESSLESLEAQQNALNRETAYATVNLTVSGPVTAVARTAQAQPPGLLGGLAAGWHAFVIAAEWLLTAAGAVAPFAAVAALAGYAVYRVRRRSRAKTTA